MTYTDHTGQPFDLAEAVAATKVTAKAADATYHASQYWLDQHTALALANGYDHPAVDAAWIASSAASKAHRKATEAHYAAIATADALKPAGCAHCIAR
jgi:hypothetical protein